LTVFVVSSLVLSWLPYGTAFVSSSPPLSASRAAPFVLRVRHSLMAAPKGKAASTAASIVSTTLVPLASKAMAGLSKVMSIVYSELSQLTKVQTLLFGMVFWFGYNLGRRPGWKRYTDASDIPSYLFGPKAPTIRGRVVSVSDGDTIRFLHVPTVFHSSRPQEGQRKSELCLPIRLCSIDAPETAKFGKPGQPFGQEAKDYLSKLVDDKMIRIRLLQKDQYGRGVAQVFCGRKGTDELLLQEGLAEVYLGMGAVYGPLGKDKYLELEEQAKKKKLGIWSQSKRESAAEFKKRTK
jgi:micrococcal nuclease